ncbi:MAG: sulfurtransferase TusA family protein [Nitrospiraceae bacterium]|nr:sulfurtransferase TusA family protein [Nitrospiraceae bacterium]
MAGKKTETLDVSRLACPVNVLQTKKMLNGMPPGKLLEVITTDEYEMDMVSFFKRTGHKLVGTSRKAGKVYLMVRKTE